MTNNLDFNQLSAEAQARLRLRNRLKWGTYALIALGIATLLLTSFEGELTTIVGPALPTLYLLYLFLTRSSIGWGVVLYIFRPSQRELLRAFPPAQMNWYPLLIVVAMLIALIGSLAGVQFNAVIITAALMGVFVIQWRATNALQHGDYATVERLASFAARWLPYPNLFGHRLVALINARRLDEALAMTTEHLAHTPRLAPCLSEGLHAQAMILSSAKRYDEALPLAENALILSPEIASIYMTLADYYLTHVKNPAMALEVLDAAQPFLGAFEFNWRLYHARVYAQLGRFDEANAEIATAEKMSVVQYPQNATRTGLLFTTVDVKAHEGDLNAARAAYDMLVVLDTDGTQARSAREILDKFR